MLRIGTGYEKRRFSMFPMKLQPDIFCWLRGTHACNYNANPQMYSLYRKLKIFSGAQEDKKL